MNNGAVTHVPEEQATLTEQLADKMLQQVFALLSRRNSGEPLPEVDASLFEEISEDSMMLAREVVAQFGNLPDEEAWLLSVHFEVAKENL